MKITLKIKEKERKRIGTPVEVSGILPTKLRTFYLLLQKSNPQAHPRSRVSVAWRSWVVLFFGDNWALGKLPLEDGQKEAKVSLLELALRGSLCLSY